MKEWFALPATDRKDIIIQTSTVVALPPAAVEKDLWVTVVLNAVFNTKFAKLLVFKGGTSLSKGWKVIERFSEDIDLGIDRTYFTTEKKLSRSAVTKLRKVSAKFIQQELVPCIADALIASGATDFELHVRDMEESDTDPVTIEVRYNSLVESMAYLQPRILIEISPRSLREPFEQREIVSFITQSYADKPFAPKAIQVPTVLPTRTLLEKIFLLHEELQKPADRTIRSYRMTRHLYDISRLMETQFLEQALRDKELYKTIVEHRKAMIAIPWVDYTKHAYATLNFIPTGETLAAWEADYLAMQESMFYGPTETFANMLAKLQRLNEQINAVGTEL